ncbi:MAG: hypothetical protein IT378_19260 [Sandaracinaceae bacterium]|nr:hypothetical protein [Sandaracinaceae bacterium]
MGTIEPEEVVAPANVTIADLFPGAMGRVWLSRVALRLRDPSLLRLPPQTVLDAAEVTRLRAALADVREG